MPLSSVSHREAVTIVLEDDDDDEVQAFAPQPERRVQRRFSRRGSYTCSWSHQPVHIPVLDDEELELRLGPVGLTPTITRSPSRAQQDLSLHLAVPGLREACLSNPAIDLTHVNDDLEMRNNTVAGKRKRVWQPLSDPVMELKLTCAICMDTMEEETSTVCGHIFCNKCIMAALRAQSRCPTCRKCLTKSQIHRVYLSGSTR